MTAFDDLRYSPKEKNNILNEYFCRLEEDRADEFSRGLHSTHTVECIHYHRKIVVNEQKIYLRIAFESFEVYTMFTLAC